jgi:4-hydroxybenzoate polyprenyltransferase
MINMAKKISYFVGLLKYTRPLNHILTTITLLAGYILSRAYSSLTYVILVIISWVILGSGGTLAFNTYWDRDAKSNISLGFQFSKPKIVEDHLLYLSIIFLITGWILSIFINIYFFILYSITLFFSISYSLPPLRFKGRAGLDMFTNAIGYGSFTFLAGWVIEGALTYRTFLLSIMAFLVFASGYLGTTIYHLEHDKRTGTHTLSTAIGFNRSMIVSLCLIAITAGFILLLIMTNILRFYTTVIFIPIVLAIVINANWLKNPKKDPIIPMYKMYIIAICGWLSLIFGEIFKL